VFVVDFLWVDCMVLPFRPWCWLRFRMLLCVFLGVGSSILSKTRNLTKFGKGWKHEKVVKEKIITSALTHMWGDMYR